MHSRNVEADHATERADRAGLVREADPPFDGPILAELGEMLCPSLSGLVERLIDFQERERP